MHATALIWHSFQPSHVCSKVERKSYAYKILQSFLTVILMNSFVLLVFFQIKGIGELLEGLIPYSQRHFSRIDRLERSTYLLDYTLTGMSVVEPEIDQTILMEKDTNLSKGEKDTKLSNVTEEQLPQAAALHEGVELREMSGVKKRKSRKSRDVAYKKVKGLNDASDSAIPSKA